MMISILSVFLAFSLVIFVHEFGHFYVGKRCGIGVKEFSIGFGPKLVWFKDKSGVIWKFCLLPFGGFVKFEGDSDPSSLNTNKRDFVLNGKEFSNAPIWARSCTIFAGPLFNLIFSIIIFTGVILSNGILDEKPIIGKIEQLPSKNMNLKVGDEILEVNGIKIDTFADIILQHTKEDFNDETQMTVRRGNQIYEVSVGNLFQPIIKDIELLSPASKADLRVGDFILKVDGHNVISFADLRNAVQNSAGNVLSLEVWREGDILFKNLQPELRPLERPDGGFESTLRIGVVGGYTLEPVRKTPSLLSAAFLGFSYTWRVITGSLTGLLEILRGSISAKHLTGPVGIAHAITDVSKNGIVPFFTLVALISTGIAVVNLFPLPIFLNERH